LNFLLTDWLTNYSTCLIPSDSCNSTMAKATGLIFSLFDVTSAQEMSFAYMQCIIHWLSPIDSPFLFFFQGWMDCPCLLPPTLAVKAWTSGIYQQLNKLLKGSRVKATHWVGQINIWMSSWWLMTAAQAHSSREKHNLHRS